MPELPDIMLYLHALAPRLVGARLDGLRIGSPFLLRTADPPVADLTGRAIRDVRRLGKRIVFVFEDDYFTVLHLMIAGRLHWKPAGVPVPGRSGLAAWDFRHGTLLLTEAGTKHRASLHVVRGASALAAHDPGGLDVLAATPEQFNGILARESHTLKRALTDPRLFDGIGNAYSDEILHAARLSPLRLTTQLTPEESERLFRAVKQTLTYWIDRLRTETGDAFPEKVTAFRPGMAVHGRFRKPCPVCASPVQRIRYAENEVNYCARCQTGGRLLADRSLSRLLKQDWPRSLDEWEERAGRLAGGATGAGESFGMESQPVRFERTFAVTADDIDGLGHVNNVVYLRWVQDVAAAHWESATTPAERADIGWVVLRHEIDYQHSAKPGDQVIVRTWVGPPNAATFERHTEILRAADQRVLARARSLWCPVHPRSGRVRRIDPALHDRFYAR